MKSESKKLCQAVYYDYVVSLCEFAHQYVRLVIFLFWYILFYKLNDYNTKKFFIQHTFNFWFLYFAVFRKKTWHWYTWFLISNMLVILSCFISSNLFLIYTFNNLLLGNWVLRHLLNKLTEKKLHRPPVVFPSQKA